MNTDTAGSAQGGGAAPRVIAIDGPSASGKSSTARDVAVRLGFVHLNSGLLYRAVTWTALRDGWYTAPDFDRRVGALQLDLVPTGSEFALRMGGERPGAWLQSAAVTGRVSSVAERGAVRDAVNAVMRRAGAATSLVADGRDIGTVVFPDAFLKIYLTASPDERARRRLSEWAEATPAEAIAAEARRLTARDRHDAGREIAPLSRADDAIEIDTTEMGRVEVVDEIVRLYESRKSDP
ncbi:MAG: (d)CMP kinase [Gemmatimonadales bacterium]